MESLFTPSSRLALFQFCRAQPIFGFDFDGTLTPVIADRNAAWLPLGVRRRLARLARQVPCVVISGRGYSDVLRRVRGIPWQAVVGNHGAESVPRLANLEKSEKLVREWHEFLQERFALFPGIDIEDKRFSLTIHYREVKDPKKALRFIQKTLKQLSAHHLIGGKLVVNLLPLGLPNKGTALRMLQKRLKAPRAFYVGDDLTDEDVFVLGRPRTLFSVRIGKRRPSQARYYVPAQSDIEALLDLLLEAVAR